MSKLVFVTPEGLVLSDKKTPEVEMKELTLTEIAMREAAKQSTNHKETK